MIVDDEIVAAMFKLLQARASDATICPSEVARALAPDWRPLMPRVRSVAIELARGGRVMLSQRSNPLSPDIEIVGPYRIALAQT